MLRFPASQLRTIINQQKYKLCSSIDTHLSVDVINAVNGKVDEYDEWRWAWFIINLSYKRFVFENVASQV